MNYLLSTLLIFFISDIPAIASSTMQLDSIHVELPKLVVVNEAGQEKALDSFSKPILVHLWASWCTSCKVEIPEIAQLAKQNQGKVTVLLVSVDTKPEEAVRALKKITTELPFWRVKDEAAAKKYWAWGLPTSYLFGEKSARALGPRKWSSLSQADFLSLFKIGT